MSATGGPRRADRGTTPVSIPAELSFEGIVQEYGKVRALDGVTTVVEPGALVCLLGESGCGKTTLLRVAAGVEMPSAGRVLLDGREASGPSAYLPPEERGIGLMFQDYALFPHLSLLDNVRFGLRRISRDEARRVALRALARVGLDHLADAFPHVLSGGEQQRVALARSVAPRPGVLLMDEPFSNLDRRLRDKVRGETVAVLRETRATTIVVTHDPEEAMRIADRIVLMRAGRIVQEGSAETLYRRPVDLAAARFFCDFNELEGDVRDGRVETPLGAFPAGGLAQGERAIVCVRPQAFRLDGGEGVPGRIVARRFLGEVAQAEFVLEGVDALLVARLRERDLPASGQDVAVGVDPAEVLVFAAGNS